MTTRSTRGLTRALSLGLGLALIGGASIAGATTAQAAPDGDVLVVQYEAFGVVEDGAGDPLAGVEASVTIPATEASSPVFLSDVTDADGVFTIAGLENGTYTADFRLEGYGVAPIEFTITDGDADLETVTMLPLTDTTNATVTISGSGQLGETLTAVTTGWPTGTVFTYNWGYGGANYGSEIPGATGSTYVVTEMVVGSSVLLSVSGKVPGVSAEAWLPASNQVAAYALQQPIAAPVADVAAYLQAAGSVPVAQTELGLPAGALNPATAQNVSLDWWSGDSFVDVYVYSSPVAVGTFPVVNGVVQFTLSTAVLGKLTTGNHTLVITGQTSGDVQSAALSIGLTATGGEAPVVPLTVASILLLSGLALVVARRRIGQRA